MGILEDNNLDRPGWKENNLNRSAWIEFNDMFKNNDDVVIVTDDDEFIWGKLTIGYNGCELKSLNKKKKFYSWDIVRFIAHDGFPVKKLKGADGSASIELLDTSKKVEYIRAIHGNSLKLKRKKVLEKLELSKLKPKSDEPWVDFRNYITFGDPFLIEGIKETVLINIGNSCWSFSDTKYEETLILKANNGTGGLLYDLPTIYGWE